MADEKPKDKGGSLKKPEAPATDPLTAIIGIIILVSVAVTILTSVGNYILNNGLTFFGISLGKVGSSLINNLWVFKIISFVVCIAALIGIVILSRKIGEILAVEKAKLFPDGVADLKFSTAEEETELKTRWNKILENSISDNESSWRIAIIEADVILDDLLDKLNLPGDTIGEKLKAVEQSDFLSIESAWEAHKVRNQIAHGGSEFHLNQRETQRVIKLYEQVFKEFYLI